jgi:hypothetical protein
LSEFNGIVTRPVVDRSTGKVAVERIQDVEDIIENNKRLQNEPQDFKTGWHHIAEIPCIFIEKWCNEKGISYREIMSADGFEDVVKRMLRDPDYMWLRVTDKRF